MKNVIILVVFTVFVGSLAVKTVKTMSKTKSAVANYINLK